MKKSLLLLALISVCLLASQNSKLSVAAAANSSAAKAEAVLGHMEDVGRGLNSLVASLWQQKTNTQLGLQDPAESGTIYYLPGKSGGMKLRIDIDKPAKTVVVSGDQVKFYQNDARQMLVTSLKSASKNQSTASLAITFGSVSAIRANYEVTYVTDEKIGNEMTSLLHLLPKQPGAYKSIDIWISQNYWLPVQQRFVEVNEDVTVVRLSNLKKNEKIDSKKLIDNFNPPNAKVVKG